MTLCEVDGAAVLDHHVDDLLLHARGLVLVREVLARRGASNDELDAPQPLGEDHGERPVDLRPGPAQRLEGVPVPRERLAVGERLHGRAPASSAETPAGSRHSTPAQ